MIVESNDGEINNLDFKIVKKGIIVQPEVEILLER